MHFAFLVKHSNNNCIKCLEVTEGGGGAKPGICPHLDFWKDVTVRERRKLILIPEIEFFKLLFLEYCSAVNRINLKQCKNKILSHFLSASLLEN
jgi:hypothetical protein